MKTNHSYIQKLNRKQQEQIKFLHDLAPEDS